MTPGANPSWLLGFPAGTQITGSSTSGINLVPGSGNQATFGPLSGSNTFSVSGTNGNTCWNGATSGSACFGVNAIAGTSNLILLPTASGTAGQELVGSGANPQQLSWVVNNIGCASVNGVTYSNVQAAMTAAGVNGLACVPATYAGVDIPLQTRVINLINPASQPQANGAHLFDYRWGMNVSSFFNPGWDGQNNLWNASENVCNFNENVGNALTTTSGANNLSCVLDASYYLSGTQNVNQNGYTNKTNITVHYSNGTSYTPGQFIPLFSQFQNYSSGDLAMGFDQGVKFGESNAGSDEGLEWRDISVSTGYVEYQCPLTANAVVGTTTLTCGSATQGAGTQAADRTVYDITKAYNTGTVVVGAQAGMVTITGTATNWTTSPLPTSPSTATTTSAAITVPTATTTTSAITTTGSQSIPVTSSTGFSVNAQVSISDGTPNNFDTVTITAIADGTHITAAPTKTHLTGAGVSQTEPGSVNILVGSSTGIVTNNILCVADTTSFEFVTVTNVPDGTHITGYFHLPHASGATIATGGLCGYGIEFTDDDWSTTGAIGFVSVTGTLRQVWPVVKNTSATSLTILISVAGNGDSYGGMNNTGAYKLYPIAKTWQGTHYQSNTLTIEPLAVAMSNADSLSMATGPAIKHTGMGNWQINNFFPSQGLGGYSATINYNGIVSGNDIGFGINNNTVASLYTGHGGHLSVPLGMYYNKGLYKNGLYFTVAPDNAAIFMGCNVNASGAHDCTSLFSGNCELLAQYENQGGSTDFLSYCPTSATQFWKMTFQNQAQNCTFGQTGNGISCSGGMKAANFSLTNLVSSNTAPTIAAAGCGGGAASILVSNGTAAFKIGVGTTPGSACTITMPSATTGWNCHATDITTNSTSVFLQKQTGAESQTSVTITNFSDVAVATAFVASDVLKVQCAAD